MIDPTQILVTVPLGLGIFLLIYAVFRFPVQTEPPVHRRVASAMGSHRETFFEQPLLAPLMSLGLLMARRFTLTSLRQRIRQDLNASGNPSGYSVEEYLAICLLCTVVLGGAAAFLELARASAAALVIVPVMAGLGFGAPLWTLSLQARKRTARIAKQLPYTLDLISLVMAAGSSFTEAIQTLIRDDPDDDLNQELALVLHEIEFGTTRAAALQNMASRIPLESLRSVVGAAVQAENLGTPLSSILKLQAEMLRMHRSVRAEKLSASASLRILVPSMLILIAVVVVVFSTMLIRWVQGTLL